MKKAIWNNAELASSDACVMVEGNAYFPADTVDMQYIRPSEKHTHCSWKGQASYYHVTVGDEVNQDAAWYYPAPLKDAEKIKDYVAFWKGVEVIET